MITKETGMTEQSFTFTAAQIMDIVHEAHFASSYTDAREDMIMRVRDMVNEGKPEAEWVSRATVFGWFGVKPPSWVSKD
jgi:cytochrome c-type biogenesis protein CcmH/NrfF